MKGIILTVGESPEPIIFSLNHHKPDRIVFLCTPQSCKFLDEVWSKFSLKPSQHKTYEVQDSPDQTGLIVERAIDGYRWLLSEGVKDKEITADPTGGRKWMSAGLIIFASALRLDMAYVDAKYKESKIDKASMKVVSLANALEETAILEIKKGVEYFNGFLYKPAEKLFKSIRTDSTQLHHLFEGLASISEAYHRWDLFTCYDKPQPVKGLLEEGKDKLRIFIDNSTRENHAIEDLMNKLDEHISLLNDLREKEKLNILFVFDLVHNAKRRYEVGRFDDAVARLYRALEAFSQVIYHEQYGIDSKKPEWDKLDSDKQDALKKVFTDKLPDKISLNNGFLGLYAMENSVAKQMGNHDTKKPGKFKFKGGVEGILSVRNDSILAHGFEPVNKEAANDFLDKIEDVLKKHFNKDYESYWRRFEFPTLPDDFYR